MWAFLFPGQGSQHPGMGRFLFDNFTIAKQTFEEASDAIGVDLKKLCFEGSEADLTLTENTQPCLTVVSTATERVLRSEIPFKMTAVAGHSVGEYSALVAAGSITLTHAVQAVRLRGQAMQSAVPVGQGGMAAVMGLDETQIQILCEKANQAVPSGKISPANFNSPGQIVISGSQNNLQWLIENYQPEMLGAEGPKRVKFIPLQVSAPFHCELMRPAENTMREFLKNIEFQNAKIPVVQNLNAKAVQNAQELRENLIRQVTGSVRWQQSIIEMKSMNINQLVEAGCGKTLAGLVKKIDSEAFTVFNVNSLEDFRLLQGTIQDKNL